MTLDLLADKSSSNKHNQSLITAPNTDMLDGSIERKQDSLSIGNSQASELLLPLHRAGEQRKTHESAQYLTTMEARIKENTVGFHRNSSTVAKNRQPLYAGGSTADM